MPTSRRKSSGFSSSVEEKEDTKVEAVVEETVAPEEPKAEKVVEEPVAPPKEEILPPITPPKDLGFHFAHVEEEKEKEVAPAKSTPKLQPKPKRHPRNIPKFSRFN